MGEIDLDVINDKSLEEASMALKVLSHPIRLKILCVLGDGGGEISVQEIVNAIGSSQSNVSQHLTIMREKGVISSRKDGNRVMYRIGDDRMVDLFHMMRDVICDQF